MASDSRTHLIPMAVKTFKIFLPISILCICFTGIILELNMGLIWLIELL